MALFDPADFDGGCRGRDYRLLRCALRCRLLIRNYWILKLDVAGEIDWQKVLQWPRGEYAHTIEENRDGGYILAGYTAEYSKALRVIGLYPDGRDRLEAAYPGLSGWRHTSAIRQTEDLGYVAVASTSGAYSTVAVLKLTSDGSVSWQRSYDPGSASEAHSVVQTSDGGYLVAGNTCLPAICNLGDSKIWLLRLDSLGVIVWAKIHQGQFNIFNSSPVQQTQDGGFVVAAHTVAPGDQDMLLLKLDANGEITDPECNTLSDNAPVVLDTSIEPLSTSLVATETPVVAMVTDIAPQDLSLSQNVNCYVPVSSPTASSPATLPPGRVRCSSSVPLHACPEPGLAPGLFLACLPPGGSSLHSGFPRG